MTQAEPPYVPLPPFVRPPEHAAGPLPGPPGGYPYHPAYPLPAAPAPGRPVAGHVGLGVAAVGALCVITSLLGLDWYSLDGGLSSSDVHDTLTRLGDYANQLALVYHGWLAWVLLLVCAGSALLACLPGLRLTTPFRVVGALVSGVAVLLTFASFDLTDPAYSTALDSSQYLDHLGPGFWTALVGFALLGAGAVVGPRRVADPAPSGDVSPSHSRPD